MPNILDVYSVTCDTLMTEVSHLKIVFPHLRTFTCEQRNLFVGQLATTLSSLFKILWSPELHHSMCWEN